MWSAANRHFFILTTLSVLSSGNRCQQPTNLGISPNLHVEKSMIFQRTHLCHTDIVCALSSGDVIKKVNENSLS